MPVWVTKNSFNAGELSPKMFARTDVSQYSKGCSKLENFHVTPYGAIERRKGFNGFDSANTYNRIASFVFSDNVAYIVEFANTAAGVSQVKNNNIVKTDIRFDTPYTKESLDKLRFIQSADVMTIVHPDHPPMELKRIAENSFTLTEKEFIYPPVLDPNLNDDINIFVTKITDDYGNLVDYQLKAKKADGSASFAIFDEGNVDGYWQLVFNRKSNGINKDFKSDTTSDTLEVLGNWTFSTHGTWSGVLTIERSFDRGATWEAFQTYSVDRDSNISTSGNEEDEGVLYRLKMENYSASNTGTLKLCRARLYNPGFKQICIFKINSVDDYGTRAYADLLKGTLDNIAQFNENNIPFTHEWNEGAWSKRRGFPCSVSFFEERMFFAGTRSNPQTIWGSKTNAWNDFLIGTKDNEAVQFTLASDTVNAIHWMIPHDVLIIGTDDSEWTLSASHSEEALTPSNFRLRRRSVFGVAPVQPTLVGDTLLFVQEGGRKVREFVYSWEKDGYSAPDMTILADHITESKIKEMVLCRVPDTTLYCLLNDGTIAALSYERDQDVVAWYKIKTCGKIVSIAGVPCDDRDFLVCVIADEENNVAFKAFIDPADNNNWIDGAVCELHRSEYDKKTRCYINLFFMEKEFQIYVNGTYVGSTTLHWSSGLTSDSFILDDFYDIPDDADLSEYEVVVGINYESICQPVPLELDAQDGSTLFRRKRIGQLRLRTYDSIGGEIKVGDGDWQQITAFDPAIDRLDQEIKAKTENTILQPLGGFSESIDIQIRQNKPLPLNVNAIAVNYEVQE